MVVRIIVFVVSPSARSPFHLGSSNALWMFQASLHFLAVTSIALLFIAVAIVLLCALVCVHFCVRLCVC